MNKKTLLIVIVIVIIVGLIGYFESQKPKRSGGNTDAEIANTSSSERVSQKIGRYERAKEIVNPSGFLNTESGLKIDNLIGEKVILVDFWTYSCINCQRTLPYLNAWYEKYRDQGLEIIGIHTPEFEFEKEAENVQQAIDKYGIEYPVVQDNDYSTWSAYKNRYWPRKYLIDIDGFIVYDHIGEGSYDETEKKIQELLDERKQVLGTDADFDRSLTNPENAEEVISRKRTPEIYFGASRNEHLGNGTKGKIGSQNFSIPENFVPNQFYLEGQWNVGDEFAKSPDGSGKIAILYQAQKVFMVAQSDRGVLLQIYIDGNPVGQIAGRDVDGNGQVYIQEEDLYRLIEAESHGEHLLEIEVLEGSLDVFTFTFG